MSKNNFSKFIKLSFFIAIAFLFSVNTFAQEKSKIIESVDIQGNRRLADEEIYAHIKTRALQILNKKQLQTDLETLINLGCFDSTQIKTLTEIGIKGGVVVIFQVRELPIIDEVTFDGLENFSKEEIITALEGQKLNIEKGNVYNPAKSKKASLFLKEFFAERGFFNAKVEVWEEEISALFLKLSFHIEEKPEN